MGWYAEQRSLEIFDVILTFEKIGEESITIGLFPRLSVVLSLEHQRR